MDRPYPKDPLAELSEKVRVSGWTMRADAKLDFVHPPLNDLRDLWFAKSEALGHMPRRADFDARSLKPFLRNLAIVERVVDEGRIRYRTRLHGSLLVQYFGEQTGKFLDQSIPPDVIESFHDGYDAVLQMRKPVRALSFYQIPSVDYLAGESFAVALGNEEDRPVQVLSATYLTSKKIAALKF